MRHKPNGSIRREEIGQRLNTYRLRKHWALRVIADKSGLSVSGLQRIVTGDVKKPSELTLQKLIESLPGFLEECLTK